MYVDENDFVKKYKSLRKYCYKSYKFLCFGIKKRIQNFEEGSHELIVPTDEKFKKVYGQIILKYSIQNGVIVIENLEPSKFLLDGYMVELNYYKGIPFRHKKDKFKIDLVMKMEEQK